MELNSMYGTLGVSPAVCQFGENILSGLRERFDAEMELIRENAKRAEEVLEE